MPHDHRGFLALILTLALPAVAFAQTPPSTAPIEGGPDFFSPVGEPFHSPDKLSGAEHWFAGADADHDGRLTLAEYLIDAGRFFQRVDRDHNRVIEPAEIDYYENEIAPEVHISATVAEWQPRDEDAGSDAPKREAYPNRLGAGRYSWIDIPEPLLPMDTNFDRGISPKEYADAAKKRFAILDADHDGVLTRGELPKIEAAREGGKRSKRR